VPDGSVKVLGFFIVKCWRGGAGWMFTAELNARIRRAVVIEGLSRREAAQRFVVHRKATVRKMES